MSNLAIKAALTIFKINRRLDDRYAPYLQPARKV